MALVIEDGTGVDGANSYVEVADLDTFAAARGITLPVEEAAKEILLVKAMDYLEAKELTFLGYRQHATQILSWPRIIAMEPSGIPESVKKAQMVVAIAAQSIDLFPNRAASTQNATRKTVGPITVEYSSGGSSGGYPSIPQADALLRPFLNYGSGQLRVIRG